MTLNESWGYQAGDEAWKSPQKVIEQLVDVVSKGGAFLLNVGPTAEGEIQAHAVAVLAEVGDWLAIHGEAVYGATPVPQCTAPDGTARPWRATRQGDRCFIHLFAWPTGPVVIDGVPGQVTDVGWLNPARTAPVAWTQDGSTVTLDLPDRTAGDSAGDLVPVLSLTLSPAS